MTPQELLNANHIQLKSYAPGEHSTICPECSAKRSKAHQRTPCLSVKIDGQGATWYCHHCAWHGPEKGDPGPTNGHATFYIYHAADGTIAFRKLRGRDKTGKKTFWIERPDGKGGWIKGTKDKNGNSLVDTSILYRLPEVIEAVAQGYEIVCVEGEKDADRLWSIGIPATCNAHGAADATKNQQPKWKAEHSEQVRGALILVIPDRDNAGYAHAEATCKLSLSVAKRVRRLVLREHWPECPKGGDVSDYLDAGHTREQLDELIAKAPDYTPPGEQEILPLHWHGEIDPLDSRPWLIQDLLPEVGVGWVSGQWGTYKTFTVLDIATCIMTSRPFLDFDIVRPGGVLMLALEGQSEVAIRCQAVLEKKGGYVSGKHAPFAWTEVSPPLTDPKTADVIIATAKAVEAKLKERFNLPLSLILIDSLMAGAGYTKEGQDNDAALTSIITANMGKVSRALGCFTFLLDHYGKDTQVGTRGSSAKECNPDVILALLGDRQDAGQVTNCRLAIRKRRTGENGVEFAFKPRRVEMGLNPKTEKMETTLVIDWGEAEQPGTAKPKRNEWGNTKGAKVLRKIIMELLVECGEEIMPFANGPMVRALKTDLVEAEFFKSYRTSGETEKAKKDAKRKAFQRALDAASDKIITREVGGTDYVWLSKPGPGETVGAGRGKHGLIHCQQCGAVNPPDAVVCTGCKAQLQEEEPGPA